MGLGRKITINKMVNDGDLQWSFEYDRGGCNCSKPHSFTLSSQNKIIPAVGVPGHYWELTVSIGAGKVVLESCLLDENQANKLDKSVDEWEMLDNDNLKMRWVKTYLIPDIQISFSLKAERIWVFMSADEQSMIWYMKIPSTNNLRYIDLNKLSKSNAVKLYVVMRKMKS